MRTYAIDAATKNPILNAPRACLSDPEVTAIYWYIDKNNQYVGACEKFPDSTNKCVIDKDCRFPMGDSEYATTESPAPPCEANSDLCKHYLQTTDTSCFESPNMLNNSVNFDCYPHDGRLPMSAIWAQKTPQDDNTTIAAIKFNTTCATSGCTASISPPPPLPPSAGTCDEGVVRNQFCQTPNLRIDDKGLPDVTPGKAFVTFADSSWKVVKYEHDILVGANAPSTLNVLYDTDSVRNTPFAINLGEAQISYTAPNCNAKGCTENTFYRAWGDGTLCDDGSDASASASTCNVTVNISPTYNREIEIFVCVIHDAGGVKSCHARDHAYDNSSVAASAPPVNTTSAAYHYCQKDLEKRRNVFSTSYEALYKTCNSTYAAPCELKSMDLNAVCDGPYVPAALTGHSELSRYCAYPMTANGIDQDGMRYFTIVNNCSRAISIVFDTVTNYPEFFYNESRPDWLPGDEGGVLLDPHTNATTVISEKADASRLSIKYGCDKLENLVKGNRMTNGIAASNVDITYVSSDTFCESGNCASAPDANTCGRFAKKDSYGVYSQEIATPPGTLFEYSLCYSRRARDICYAARTYTDHGETLTMGTADGDRCDYHTGDADVFDFSHVNGADTIGFLFEVANYSKSADASADTRECESVLVPTFDMHRCPKMLRVKKYTSRAGWTDEWKPHARYLDAEETGACMNLVDFAKSNPGIDTANGVATSVAFYNALLPYYGWAHLNATTPCKNQFEGTQCYHVFDRNNRSLFRHEYYTHLVSCDTVNTKYANASWTCPTGLGEYEEGTRFFVFCIALYGLLVNNLTCLVARRAGNLFGCTPVGRTRRDDYSVCYPGDFPVLTDKRGIRYNSSRIKDTVYNSSYFNAYNYQFDDISSTKTCRFSDFKLTLCPSESGQESTPPPLYIPENLSTPCMLAWRDDEAPRLVYYTLSAARYASGSVEAASFFSFSDSFSLSFFPLFAFDSGVVFDEQGESDRFQPASF
ncbi:hypothetical protein CYMTET_37394 [Cymbomonas tetramitiformis]|uniref:Uncharacterized protein n=1 Tax=Cymbomonas tetramitiformis TaxID=36881 RepID=A0AAE0CG94_9CHLO|nr:hypothetical protein CYMTET_37394 [Cymbomonas tetramitiformis]